MTNSDLSTRAREIIGHMTEREAIAEVIAECYAAAKDAGYTTAALKKAIKIARMDADKRAKHESEQMDLEMYLAEIEGRTLREEAA